MDPREYQARKLDIADLIRNAMNLARERKDEESIGAARDLLSRLASDRFNVAVIGQFSRGKSTLMNAVLGGSYLPTGATPTTSIITNVRFGERPRAFVFRRKQERPTEIAVEDLASLVTVAAQQEQAFEIEQVDVELPTEILRLGFSFVDTPGVGSAIHANTATTEHFAPEADAVILVTSVDSPLTEIELDFLRRTGGFGAELFLVLNKIDLVTQPELESTIEFVKQEIANVSGSIDGRIFPASARLALEAKQGADHDQLLSSGLTVFENALVEFLTLDKASTFLRRVCDRTRNLLAHQRFYVELTGRHGSETQVAQFSERVEMVLAAAKQAIKSLQRQVDGDLRAWLEGESASWTAGLRQELLSEFDRLWPIEAKAGAGVRLVEVARTLNETGTTEVGDVARKAAGGLRQHLSDIAARAVDLKHIGRPIEFVASEIFAGSSLEPVSLDKAELELPPLLTRQVDWAFEPTSPIWTRIALGGSSARNRARDELLVALDNYSDRLEQTLTSAAREWIGSLSTQIEDQLKKTSDTILCELASKKAQAQMGTLARMERSLEELRQKVSEPTRRRVRSSVVPTPGTRPTARRGCLVCDRLGRAQFDYLRESQYQLATYELRQVQHASEGGYCPFHTWVYADLSSPVGISAGYAPLASRVGAALRALNHHARSVSDLASGVRTLLQRSSQCPACKALERPQREAVAAAIDSIRKDASAEGAVSLCLPHLFAVLEAEPRLEQARRFVDQLADSLIRGSEDMRSYALKREALRRELLTSAEEKAVLECLVLLVGRPDLARRFSGPTEVPG